MANDDVLDGREALFKALLKIRHLSGVMPDKYRNTALIELKRCSDIEVAELFSMTDLTAEEILWLKTEAFLQVFGQRFSLGQIAEPCLRELARLIVQEADVLKLASEA